MAKVYATKIISSVDGDNPFTIENVLAYWYETTLTELTKRGYDGYGQKLPTE